MNLTKNITALATMICALSLSGCSDNTPTSDIPKAQDVSYANAFIQQQQTWIDVGIAEQANTIASEADIQEVLGLKDSLVAEFYEVKNKKKTLCVQDTVSNVFVISTREGQEETILFSSIACAYDSKIAFLKGTRNNYNTDPFVFSIVDSSKITQSQAQEVSQAALTLAEGTQARANIQQQAEALGKELASYYKKNKSYPGVAAQELTASLGYDLKEPAVIQEWLPADLSPAFCITDPTTQAWVVYEIENKRAVGAGDFAQLCQRTI